MKKCIFILGFWCLSLSAFPWGATGHRVIGAVAQKYLSKNAKRNIEKLLGYESMAMASNWMDEIRSDSTYRYANDWHWVTIPDGMTYAQSEKNPKGDLIQTIERLITELKNKKLTPAQELVHLKMLIHLIGDVHQPLHAGRGEDFGGNGIKVTWHRAETDLHTVWDSDMINETKLSYTEFAQSLQPASAEEIKTWQSTNVNTWAQESVALRSQVYDIGNGKLGYRYSFKNMPTVRLRLNQAGVRLAAVLNEIYGK
jgi:hypothetical protein